MVTTSCTMDLGGAPWGEDCAQKTVWIDYLSICFKYFFFGLEFAIPSPIPCHLFVC
jgi:hypothetical protein